MLRDVGATPAPPWKGFDYDRVDVEDYERLRPTYAPESLEWLCERTGIGAGSSVVELAAGTGKLTRLLVERGMSVTAVEPSGGMRGILRRTAPDAVAVDGSAERIPAGDGSCDTVVAAQAFHHFEGEGALAEIHRVLAPHGWLALFWNIYRPDDPLKRAIDEIIDRFVGPGASAAFGGWRDVLARDRRFRAAGTASFPHPHELPAASLARLLATSSDVASLRPTDRERLLADAEALASGLPDAVSIQADTRVDLYRRNP
jgi:ubiquinone/menaquinone biosynthesis C-methylase UbiE